MYNPSELMFAILAVGVGATLVMDLWALFLKRVLAVPSLSYCLVGRWVSHMATGVFWHTKISNADVRAGECALGWVVHYLIGIAYAAILLVPMQGVWLSWLDQTPLSAFSIALLFGLTTVVFPFFIMQPALGFGIAAGNNPNPVQARLKTLVTHSVFGVGLFAAGLIYQWLQP